MKNILVVESNQNFSYLLCQFLRSHNFHVIEANNIFIGSYLAKEQYPNLIIYSLDIVEEISYQIFQKMHESSTALEIPLIFLTNNTDISYSFKKISQLKTGIILNKTLGFSRILKVIQLELNKNTKTFNISGKYSQS